MTLNSNASQTQSLNGKDLNTQSVKGNNSIPDMNLIDK